MTNFMLWRDLHFGNVVVIGQRQSVGVGIAHALSGAIRTARDVLALVGHGVRAGGRGHLAFQVRELGLVPIHCYG